MHESENESEVAQSCATLHDHMDCSLPGSTVHGIFQARVLELGVIAFSPIYYLEEFKLGIYPRKVIIEDKFLSKQTHL